MFGKNLNFYVALRDIAPNEELFIDYGDAYGNDLRELKKEIMDSNEEDALQVAESSQIDLTTSGFDSGLGNRDFYNQQQRVKRKAAFCATFGKGDVIGRMFDEPNSDDYEPAVRKSAKVVLQEDQSSVQQSNCFLSNQSHPTQKQDITITRLHNNDTSCSS